MTVIPKHESAQSAKVNSKLTAGDSDFVCIFLLITFLSKERKKNSIRNILKYVLYNTARLCTPKYCISVKASTIHVKRSPNSVTLFSCRLTYNFSSGQHCFAVVDLHFLLFVCILITQTSILYSNLNCKIFGNREIIFKASSLSLSLNK